MKVSWEFLCIACVIVCLSVFFLTRKTRYESFGASAGGSLIQLSASHIPTKEEAEENDRYNRYIVTRDIVDMTEPENAGKYGL